MEKRPERMIDISQYGGIGLILLAQTGVFYTTQAEGMACSHPKAEGVFVPIPVKPGAQEIWVLQQCFRGELGPISKDSAEIVDRTFKRNGHVYLKVNRARLNESYEAWIHVLVDDSQKPELPLTLPISGFGKCEGILTWPNSD